MPKTSRRTKRLVDWKLQISLLLRTVFHWVFFLAVAFGFVTCWEFLLGEPGSTLYSCLEKTWARYAPAVIVLVALLPVVVYDSLRLSHRLAGPMLRIRNAIHRVLEGERVAAVKFRKHDFWHEVANDFNELLARIQADDHLSSSDAPGASEEPEPVDEPVLT